MRGVHYCRPKQKCILDSRKGLWRCFVLLYPDFSPRISPSMRERAIATSPASLTRRSTRSERTRSNARLGSSDNPVAGASGSPVPATHVASAPFRVRAKAATSADIPVSAVIARAAISATPSDTAGMSPDAASDSASPTSVGLPRKPSSSALTRSYEVTSPSKMAGAIACDPSALSTRDSMLCVTWPIAMAPAIRALPLSVCSVRCNPCELPVSKGAASQDRNCWPSKGTSSAASSRKIGSNCGSISSSMRSSNRSAGSNPRARVAPNLVTRIQPNRKDVSLALKKSIPRQPVRSRPPAWSRRAWQPAEQSGSRFRQTRKPAPPGNLPRLRRSGRQHATPPTERLSPVPRRPRHGRVRWVPRYGIDRRPKPLPRRASGNPSSRASRRRRGGWMCWSTMRGSRWRG